MLKTLAIILLVVLLVGLVGFVVTRPDTFRVARSTSIDAPADRIYPLIADLHRWSSWSPWEKLDPDMQRTFSGPESGTGAGYAWAGDGNVGKGSMQITAAAPPSRVVMRLDFLEPFEAHNTAEFTLQSAGAATEVTWAMFGPNTLLGKVMSLFFSMDSMVGTQFESGLANLKRLAEQ